VVATVACVLVPASAFAWKPTHKVSIKGTFVNHWTISEDQDCDPVGDGTLTVKFKTTVKTRVLPYRDNDSRRGWNVGIPFGYKGQLVTAMKPAKATATVTRVDNTTPKPPADPADTCPPLSKKGCGTSTQKASAYVYGGHRPKHISVHMATRFTAGDCLIGDVSSFDANRAFVGGNRDGNLLVKMPKESAFRKPVVRVHGRTHKQNSGGDPGESFSDDITRKVTVTFKHR
jgi:hypothetical protein